jgi:hypothetical protein
MQRRLVSMTMAASLFAMAGSLTAPKAQDWEIPPGPMTEASDAIPDAVQPLYDPVIDSILGSNPYTPHPTLIDPGRDPGIPVDGGLTLLLGTGLAYGAARLHRLKRPPPGA